MDTDTLTAPLESDDVLEDRLQRCLGLAREAVGAERGCLLVTRAGREQLLHDGDESLRLKFPFSRRLVGEVMVRGSCVVSFRSEPSHLMSKSSSLALYGVRAALGAPILSPEGEDMGVIYFDTRVGDGSFSDEQVERIRNLAEAIGRTLVL